MRSRVCAPRALVEETEPRLSDPHEIKSLIRLAGILDQLAQLTGYEPKPEDYLTTTAAAPAPSTEAMTFPPLLEAASFNVSEEIIAAMVNCLDKSNNDSRPAYERCPRAPIPAGLQTLFNITDPGSGDNLNTPSTDNPTVVRRRKSTSTHSETIDEPSYRKPERRSARPSTRTVDYRLPEDPYQDISGYSKSKEGVSIMPNPEQAEQVRLALERHFASPDMETVRRYGSNYNPLIPNAPLAGMIRTLLDI
ncbi:hypothetical protein EVAR_15989_1 [Eumeta japonica]|uniref:Uncharacterized protein n=1 Tax=Eumeta variegata TaxID=151549 RepID=A0A4C1UMK0_EUMVA|nr:hypothetical protein EVAR_15989_1 [Eumeta japonica]